MYWGLLLREYFLERSLADTTKALSGLKAALELELRREELEAASYRRLAKQACELELVELKATPEGMAADQAGRAGELRRSLAGK